MHALTEIDPLVDLLAGRRLVVLTGAGCSTESGIPDYRGPGMVQRARAPIQYRDFVGSAETRQRYWARSVVAFRRFASVSPNAAHRGLVELEQAGRLVGLITQNVDRLHTRAGSRRLVELHGAIDEVVCLGCRRVGPRAALQERLEALNPAFVGLRADMAPDGDAELAPELVEGFRVAPCEACGGMLKPHVVFFGENVPRPVVDEAWRLVAEAEAMLVVGSSLVVWSGLRFVRGAAERGLPIGIVNVGETRGDPFATLRVDGRAGEVLPALTRRLLARVA